MKLLLIFKVFILLTVFPLLLACSSTPEPPPPLELNVSTNIQANNGDLFYVVAKTCFFFSMCLLKHVFLCVFTKRFFFFFF